uniref:Uncharacterized protein n=1 Tax=Biomphalaria glabrata TaxID=6526 RepID=A0A2C9KFX2_BIOGL
MKVRKIVTSKPNTKMKITKRKLPKSSSSNPTTKKFREAVRQTLLTSAGGVFLQSNKTPLKSQIINSGSLTLEALEKHNASTHGFTEASIQDDVASMGGTTFNTWATNLTGCTNITFSRVHHYLNSNNAIHKEILAVLAAITEVIKENGGIGTDVQYFATLVTSLESADKTETRMAMAHLLSVVIKRVPVSVLRSRYSQVEKILLNTITECVQNQVLSPLKPALSCLASLLRVQDLTKWLDGSTTHAFNALLAFITHKKPKLRRAAQTAIKVVLKGSLFMQQTPAPPCHPAAPVTANYCEKQIEAFKGHSNKTEVLHMLSLLKNIIFVFPAGDIKTLCETMLRFMTLTDLIMKTSCMEVLYHLFSAKPSAQCMPAAMNAQILTALHEYQPSDKDSQQMLAWIKVIEAATLNLVNQDLELGMNHLPHLFSKLMSCLLTNGHDVAKAAVESMKTLLLSVNKEKVVKSSTSLAAIQKLVKTMEAGLGYQFCSVWSLVLQLWSTAFLALGSIIPQALLSCLSSLGELRDSPHFSYKGEMDHAVGSAVKSMGPRLVLEALPLGITGENDNLEFPRGWLLPVIRDNVTHTELNFFAVYFLPLAAKFKTKADELSKEKRLAESKVYETLHHQMWSLLKGFCDHPTDITKSFQAIAKTLGTALNEREDLQLDVMSALRSLITCSLQNESDKKELGRFAKNYLPILFNLFTEESKSNDGVRLAALETIKKYMLVTDKKLVMTYLDKCLEKIDLDSKNFKNVALLDLVIAMIPYADDVSLNKIFNLSLQELSSEDKGIQKKSYRVLEEISKSESSNCKEIVLCNLQQINETILKSLSKSSPAAKAPRLRCLIYLYRNLQDKSLDFFLSTLPEAILCTKEIGSKAKAVAFDLLVVMAETYMRWNPEHSENGIVHCFVCVLNVNIEVRDKTAYLNKLCVYSPGKLTGPILDNLIDNACLLLSSKTKEVSKAAVGFIKVLLSVYENTVIASHLKQLLNSLHDVAVKGSMKRFIKIIYAKFIKKFGYELILSMTKPSVHKLLKNLHKAQERAKRKKNGKENSEDDSESESDDDKFTAQPESIDDLLQDTDSELDEEEEGVSKKKSKRKRGNDAWLMESGENIVDFMDPGASKQVLATKPETGVKEKKSDQERGFKFSSDGRLIITKDEEENKKDKSNKKVKDIDAEDDDLNDSVGLYVENIKTMNRKRKLTTELDDEEDIPPASKYKAGGSGIHRPVKNTVKEKIDIGQEYRSKKALGDVKKKGKPDPYAYVPLNFNHLNKRKQMKVKGTFSNLVKGAKKGAAKGNKSRVHQKRKK